MGAKRALTCFCGSPPSAVAVQIANLFRDLNSSSSSLDFISHSTLFPSPRALGAAIFKQICASV